MTWSLPGLAARPTRAQRATPPDPDSGLETQPGLTPAFLITVDTEGDNLWGRPTEITTRNAACLPRLQQLCEAHGFKPTWLANFEMAMSADFVAFGRAAQHRGTAEVGMHLHAWNSPPLQPLTANDFHHQPFLVEYPAEQMEAKIAFITELLRDRFDGGITSHRAGRWAFNPTYARLLVRHGYQVDCSVCPHVSWADAKGDPAGHGGTDYRRFPDQPYWLDLDDIAHAGHSGLLEVPVSIVPSTLQAHAPQLYQLPGLRRWAWRLQPRHLWLYPTGRNLSHLLTVVRHALATQRPCLELALHSSDLMPGGGPHFPDADSVEALFRDLGALFTVIARTHVGMTLSEFRAAWAGAPQRESRTEPGLEPAAPASASRPLGLGGLSNPQP